MTDEEREREMLYGHWRERQGTQPRKRYPSLEEKRQAIQEINQELAKCREILTELRGRFSSTG
jgi:hypothetical protein